MKFFSVFLVAVSLLGVSCERHEFEGANGTKQLHGHHAAAGGHEEASGHVEKAGHSKESEEGDVKDGKVLKH